MSRKFAVSCSSAILGQPKAKQPTYRNVSSKQTLAVSSSRCLGYLVCYVDVYNILLMYYWCVWFLCTISIKSCNKYILYNIPIQLSSSLLHQIETHISCEWTSSILLPISGKVEILAQSIIQMRWRKTTSISLKLFAQTTTKHSQYALLRATDLSLPVWHFAVSESSSRGIEIYCWILFKYV